MITMDPRLRARVRSVAIDAAAVGRQISLRNSAAMTRARVYLPYFHAVSPEREPAFRAFVAALAEDHTFVSYDEAVRRALYGPIDKPYVAFSFDDGFASNVALAGILEEFGARGCFFVPTAFIGTTFTTAQARAFFGCDWLDERAMTWAELEDLKSRGHAIENHTVNHPVLSQVSEQQAVDEIYGAAEELRRRFGSCTHFAWPRGRFSHFTPAAASAVFASGHVSCASAERGAHATVNIGDPTQLCLRRDHHAADWPLRHSLYFAARTSDRSAGQVGGLSWPTGWDVGR